MGRQIDDVIKSLPAERQAKITNITRKNVEAMIAHATALSDFRKAVGKTQTEVAKELGINQNAVSQLENRSDIYVSTLRRFLKSLGLTLEMSVVDRNGVRIDLPKFIQLGDEPQADSGDVVDKGGNKKRTNARSKVARDKLQG
jgi:transcriptional regulator with XRE-family HTH domain